MNNSYKISYQKHWSEEGTVYNQRVKISKIDYFMFFQYITLEMSSNFPLKDKYCFNECDTIYMHRKNIEDKIVFLHSTERRFFCLMMDIKLKDRNTYLVIE